MDDEEEDEAFLVRMYSDDNDDDHDDDGADHFLSCLCSKLFTSLSTLAKKKNEHNRKTTNVS